MSSFRAKLKYCPRDGIRMVVVCLPLGGGARFQRQRASQVRYIRCSARFCCCQSIKSRISGAVFEARRLRLACAAMDALKLCRCSQLRRARLVRWRLCGLTTTPSRSSHDLSSCLSESVYLQDAYGHTV